MNKIPTDKIVLGIVALTCFIVLMSLMADGWKHRDRIEKAKQLNLGDSRENVLASLGEPDGIWEADSVSIFFRNENETWVYGKTYDLRKDSFALEYPYFYPLRLRFAPYEDDIVLEFNEDGELLMVQGEGWKKQN